MPTVTVRHFAQLRERRGADEETVEVPDGCTLGDLFQRLFPEESASNLAIGCAMDHVLMPSDTRITEGAQVAFLPPIGGG
jgi:molybdopterin synthase sulfur carrier subunit